MRKQLLGVFLPLLVMVLFAAAETQSTGTEASPHAALQKVSVVRGQDGISVEITARGQVAPQLSTLDRPERVVLDLPNTVMATAQSHISVDSEGVKGVRVGMDGQKPPTTRVVVDLEQACRYELVPGSDHKLVLKLRPAAAQAAKKPAKAPVVTAAVAPARLVVKKEVATARPEAVPAPAVVVPAAESKPAASASSATDYVFVEPSYKPKDATATAENKPATIAPPARVMEAAAKFSEKPEGNLLPTPSASMQAEAAAPQPAVNMAAEQKAQMEQHHAMTGPKYTGEPISVNLKDVDLKDFFRLIHEISGLNVVLDPNVKGTLTIVLDDVPWDQALDIVLKNNALARQLDGNVLRIATMETLRKEAEARRAQQEAEALAVDKVTVTRFLSYAHSKDVVPTIKKFLTQRGDVISDDRTNALIISDIPNVMPAIDRLLTQLDRKTQEVEIEARVVAATRSFARDIGTQLGFGWGNGHTAVGGASSVGTTPTQVNGLNPGYITVGGSSTTAGTQIPLFSNLPVTSPTSGLTFINASNNARIDFILTLAESRGLLKILSRPRVVTQNNIQALVRQGVRVPIVTQAQLGGPPTVTYVDAFLRLTVIPQITSEGTIFLNVDVENTTPDFGRTVQGNPTLITQQATTQVLVTDGGTVVIGGVIQTQNSINVLQVPLLGDIPIFGNLFKRRTVNTSNQELIFFITPRIIQT
ncbi:MAG TPA: type IV pilus secretin PilQ [Terriglobales bacterium]|jgi:type IV pilus assembly protein PilQ|nr:type IV pilus secretin PilQ [Terriglobales bacterium]